MSDLERGSTAPSEGGSKKPASIHAPTENSIDLKRPNVDTGHKYEAACFRALAERFPSHYLIGPHLIDHALGRDSAFAGFKKPDAILFRTVDGVRYLYGFSEIKLHPYTSFNLKLRGFQGLLEAMEKNPARFAAALNRYLDDDHKFGDIVMPPSGPVRKVNITLVTPPMPPEKDGSPGEVVVYKRRGMHINRIPVPIPYNLRRAA